MATLNAFYVRSTPDDPATLAAIRGSFPNAKIDTGAEFVGVALLPKDFTPPEELLRVLSAQLHTDVLWLGFQSCVDALQFHHWKDGSHLRALIYGCYDEERTWECAEGSPEPWERQIFFSQDALEESLEYVEPQDRAEVERIWREGDIAAGRTEPTVDAGECAFQIGLFYGLPHYSDPRANAT